MWILFALKKLVEGKLDSHWAWYRFLPPDMYIENELEFLMANSLGVPNICHFTPYKMGEWLPIFVKISTLLDIPTCGESATWVKLFFESKFKLVVSSFMGAEVSTPSEAVPAILVFKKRPWTSEVRRFVVGVNVLKRPPPQLVRKKIKNKCISPNTNPRHR